MRARAKSLLLDLGQVVAVLGTIGFMLVKGSDWLCLMTALLPVGVAVVRSFASSFGGEVRQRVISLILVLGLAGVLIGLSVYRSTPENLFRRYVADPIPASVRIIHSEWVGGRDYAAYLHFKLSPEDLETILQAREYVQSDSLKGPIGLEPDWWSPQALNDPRLYVWRPQDRGVAAWLWVNDQGTEAYFTYWTF